MNRPENRPPPLFIAGHVALDFLNSIASPHGVPVEWLQDGSDLVAWLVDAHLLDEVTAKRFSVAERRVELDLSAASARRLREWFRRIAKAHAGSSLPPLTTQELRLLNAALAVERVTRRVAAGVGTGHSLVKLPELNSASQLVALIAAEVAEFLCQADFTHVRFCEGHLCTVAFYDQSKNNRRRWCDMAVCGNRAKQSRQRRKRVQAE